MHKKLLLICLFWISAQVIGQDFRINTKIKGVSLPSDNILSVLQVNDGTMWFNTRLGVFYSDGFFTYPIPDSIQNSFSNSISLKRDEKNRIWLSNEINIPKAFIFTDNKWKELKFPGSIIEKSFTINLNFLPHHYKGEDIFFLHGNDFLAFGTWTENSWKTFPISFDETGYLLSSIIVDDGILLLFEHTTKIWDGKEFIDFEFTGIDLPNRVHFMSFDPDNGEYYFLTKNLLAVGSEYNGPEKVIDQNFSKEPFTHRPFGKVQVVDGQVYYHYRSQLYKYNPETGTNILIDSYPALKTFFISDFFVDRENIIWLASSRGIANINSLKFFNYDSRYLLDEEVTALASLGNRRILLGFNNGIQIFEKGNRIIIDEDKELVGNPRNRITNFSEDKNGVVWMSSNMKGIGRLDLSSNKVEYTQSPDAEFVSMVNAQGDSLLIAANNRIFLSNINNRGEQHFKNEVTDYFLKIVGQEFLHIRKWDRLSDGRFILMQGANPQIFDEFISNERIIAAIGYSYLEHDGCIILGTELGLKKYCGAGNPELWEIGGRTIKNPIFCLLKDSSGNIWVGTDSGVFKINGEKIEHLTESSGLSGSEINRGALAEISEGLIWIGTSKGLSVYWAQEDKPRIEPPYVEISKITVLGMEEANLSLKNIPSTSNNIEIDFKAISFLETKKLNIRYKLEGLHDDWKIIENPITNKLVFNNLSPGNYRLLLQAELEGGGISHEVSSQEFKILQPIYLRWWFIMAVLVFFVFLGFLLNGLLTALRKEGLLKKTIDEKTKEVQDTQDQFKNVWESSQDGLMLSLDGGWIIAMNPSLRKMTNYEDVSLENKNIKDLFSDPDYYVNTRKLVLEGLEKSNGKGVSLVIEMPFHNSQSRDIELYVSRLNSDFNGKNLILSVFRDVTEKKQYERGLEIAKEKAEEANRLKSNFISNISHEIRTPLNGILGSTEHIMMQREDDQALISQLEIIQESGERLLHTINSILDLSKIEANKMEVMYKETSINDFISRIILPLKALAMKKGLLISTKYETQGLKKKVDQRYLEMIINNLVGNAIKYSEKGIISLKVRQDSGNLEIEINDQGIGMSEEFLQSIFQPFNQESQGYGRTFEGTGLGLAITKSLIELLKGEITIKSKKGEGTWILVQLPFGED